MVAQFLQPAYELTKNRIAPCQRAFRHFCNWASAAVDQPSSSHRRNADDPNGLKLDRPDRRRVSVRVAVAAGFANGAVEHIRSSFACHAEALAEAGHFASQSRGTST
jgi:hypothetical protein